MRTISSIRNSQSAIRNSVCFAALLAFFQLTSPSAQAVTRTKANNTDALNLTTSWVGGVVPGVADIGLWDSTVTGANFVTWSTSGTRDWNGVQVTNPGGLVTINNAGDRYLRVGSGGIDMSTATQNLTINFFDTNANNTWNVNAGRTLTISNYYRDAGDVSLSGGGAIVHKAAGGPTSSAIRVSSSTGFTGSYTQNAGSHATYFTAPQSGQGASWTFNGTFSSAFSPGSAGTNKFGALSGSGATYNESGGAVTMEVGALGTPTTFSGVIGGGAGGANTTALTKTGGDILTLSGDNTYTGATAINGGALTLSGSGRITSTTSVSVGAGTFLNLSAGDNAFNTASGSVAYTVNGTLKVTNTSVHTIIGDTITMNGGTIDSGSATGGSNATYGALYFRTVGSTITANGSGNTIQGSNKTMGIDSGINLTLNTPTVTDSLAVSGVIGPGNGGTGGIIKSGAGTVTLSGANTYTGLTTVSNGTLLYGANNAIFTGAVTVNGAAAVLDIATFTDSVGTVTLDGGGQITGTTGVLTSTGSFEMKSGTANASLAGSVNLNKTTAGTVILSGAGNTFTGHTTVSAGELHLDKSSGNAVNDGSLSTLFISGTVKLLDSNQIGDNGGVDINGSSGVLDMQSFSDTIYDLSTVAGSTVTGTSGSLLTVGTGTPGSGSGNVSGVIAGGVGLTKAGSGTTLNLNNVSNTYSGNTTVSAGTLALVNAGTTNNIGSSPVISVDATLDVTSLSASTLALTAGQTLQGSGTVLGNVTAATAGSTISPGNSIESLLITGDITFGAGGTFDYEIDSGAALAVGADLLYGDGGAGGALNISGSPTLSLTNLGAGSVAAGTKFTLIAYDTGEWNGGIFAGRPDDSLIYGFAGINWWINYNDTSAGSNFTANAGAPNTAWLTITATTVPEPSTYALGLVGLVALACRAWGRKRGMWK